MSDPRGGERGPAVPVPPPLIFVAGYALGWLIGRVIPIGADAPAVPALEAIGAIMAGVALGILAWAFSTFILARTPIYPNRPATTLVTHGPYSYTRNPMYLSLALLYTGLAVAMRAWWALVMLPLVLFAVQRIVIDREERYLAGEFGDAYAEYARRVRRWI
jgi:protein-S-isoprenylcysteine O-methyltransferase Ste14